MEIFGAFCLFLMLNEFDSLMYSTFLCFAPYSRQPETPIILNNPADASSQAPAHDIGYLRIDLGEADAAAAVAGDGLDDLPAAGTPLSTVSGNIRNAAVGDVIPRCAR
jgi:hypothetical protein